jgi:hypothetical protein
VVPAACGVEGETTEMRDVYNVLGDLDLVVQVRPGNGQLGGAAVALSGVGLPALAAAPRPLPASEGVSEINLGPGAALVGAMLELAVVVLRTNAATAKGSYTVSLFQRVPLGADGRPLIAISSPSIAFNRRDFGPRELDLSQSNERRDILTIALQ